MGLSNLSINIGDRYIIVLMLDAMAIISAKQTSISFISKFSLNFQALCLHLAVAYQQELALSSRLLRRCHVCLCKDHACLLAQNPPPRQLNLASFAL